MSVTSFSLLSRSTDLCPMVDALGAPFTETRLECAFMVFLEFAGFDHPCLISGVIECASEPDGLSRSLLFAFQASLIVSQSPVCWWSGVGGTLGSAWI